MAGSNPRGDGLAQREQVVTFVLRDLAIGLTMSSPLGRFVRRWLVDALAVLVAAHLVRGISYDSLTALLVASLLLGILNALFRPILLLLSLPLLLFTLGLFILVINALLLYFVGWLVASFHIASFGAAFWGALVISLVSMVVNSLIGGDHIKTKVRIQTPPSPASAPRKEEGPIIDV